MKQTLFVLLIVQASVWPTTSMAWEPGTHQALTKQAVQQSVLTENDGVLVDLGLKPAADLTQLFPDPQAGQSIYLGPNNTNLFTAHTTDDILSLIETGAVLEDEFPRSLFHFYDPVSGHAGPLSFDGVTMPYDAPDWALGNSSEPPVGQRYSLSDAANYFYQALTSPIKGDRNKAFGLMFDSLGHVMHLITEMSQPQHVRDDNHCDSAEWCELTETLLMTEYGADIRLYNPSWLESYTYIKTAAAQGYGGYPSVVLPTAYSYWADAANQGLAQFTNENFVSAGTNFHVALDGSVLSGAKYDLPFPNGQEQSANAAVVYQVLGMTEPTQIQEYCSNLNSPCEMDFVATNVTDSYTGGSMTNPYASTYSIFSQDLQSHVSQKLFTLNALNFQFEWDFLFPRAVGYGAGLINYFFRGRLDVQPDPNNPGGYLVINKSSYPMSGKFALYYDDASGNRYPVAGASWSNITLAAAGNDPADEYSIEFSAPSNPAPADPGQYMLVFQGKIGTEEGVAGKLFSEEPTYLYYYEDQGEIAYDVYTLWRLPDNTGLNLGSAQELNSTNEYLLGFAVYNGNIYTVAYQAPDFYCGAGSTGWAADAEINGNIFADASGPCGSAQTVFYGVAANTQHVYVYGDTIFGPGDEVGSIGVYDHAGNYETTLLDMPTQSLNYLSVNDSRMCLSGWADGNVDPAEILTDLNGTAIARWPGNADEMGGYPCTLTRDRFYIVTVPDEGDSYLNVYDLNGVQIASVDVARSQYELDGFLTPIVSSVTATDTNIYIETSCAGEGCSGANKILIFDRVVTRNAAGAITSETFVQQPDLIIPQPNENSGLFPWTIAVDAKDVLGSPGS